MKSYLLKITSPDGDVFAGEVVNLCVRGTEGELAVMAGHIPFVSYIKPCDCKVELPDGTERTAHTEGGILTVSTDKVVFLSGTFAWHQEGKE